jgi:hypothetical protein
LPVVPLLATGAIPNDPFTWDFDAAYGCKCDVGYAGYVAQSKLVCLYVPFLWNGLHTFCGGADVRVCRACVRVCCLRLTTCALALPVFL